MSAFPLELGLNSFGDVPTDNGRTLSDAETVRLLIEETKLAESVGLDIFSIGEHYREGFVDSAGAVILAGIATATSRIKLGTSVTVLSTNDPVRLYNEFSTLDALSHGRAQMVLGRASQTQSFPLFGYDLADYEELFEEKLELFMKLQREMPTTWEGTVRSPLVEQTLHPRMREGGIPTWIGVGGSPNSVIRAAQYGLPLMLAIIGGEPERFAGHVDLYFRALAQFGKPVQPVGQHALGLIADTDEEAAETWWRSWEPLVTQMGRERGFYPPTRERYELELASGALFVGSPETVAQKIVRMRSELHISRFDLKYDIGGLSVDARARTIELFGTKVAPRVRELLADQAVPDAREQHPAHATPHQLPSPQNDHPVHPIGATHA